MTTHQRRQIFLAVTAVIICTQYQLLTMTLTEEEQSSAAFIGLQSSINRLADRLQASIEETRVVDERSQALASMQDEEGIVPADKITLINVFIRSPAVCSTYLCARVENRLPYLRSVLVQAAGRHFGAFWIIFHCILASRRLVRCSCLVLVRFSESRFTFHSRHSSSHVIAFFSTSSPAHDRRLAVSNDHAA